VPSQLVSKDEVQPLEVPELEAPELDALVDVDDEEPEPMLLHDPSLPFSTQISALGDGQVVHSEPRSAQATLLAHAVERARSVAVRARSARPSLCRVSFTVAR
jgi:hypothetical protein